ncbi:MAG: hypothetical protein R3F43_04130 [bacterium]
MATALTAAGWRSGLPWPWAWRWRWQALDRLGARGVALYQPAQTGGAWLAASAVFTAAVLVGDRRHLRRPHGPGRAPDRPPTLAGAAAAALATALIARSLARRLVAGAAARRVALGAGRPDRRGDHRRASPSSSSRWPPTSRPRRLAHRLHSSWASSPAWPAPWPPALGSAWPCWVRPGWRSPSPRPAASTRSPPSATPLKMAPRSRRG